MRASDIKAGDIITRYGDLFQVCGKPRKGYVWVIQENGLLTTVNITYCDRFTCFKSLVEDGELDRLKNFFIPKSWLNVNA